MPKIKGERLVEIVPGYIYDRHLMLISGEPYAGKSLFLHWILHQLCLGKECFWGKLDPMKVFLCSERSEALIAEQFIGIGLTWPLPEETFQLFTMGDMPEKAHTQYLINPSKYLTMGILPFEPRLIAFDVLYKFLPRHPLDNTTKGTNDYESNSHRLQHFQSWANQTVKAGVIGVHHTSKPREGSDEPVNPLNKSLGSQAIVGTTMSTWMLSKQYDVHPLTISIDFHTHGPRSDHRRFFQLNGKGFGEVDDPSQALQAMCDLSPLQEFIFNLIGDSKEVSELVELVREIKPTFKNCNIHRTLNELAKKGRIIISSDRQLVRPVQPN